MAVAHVAQRVNFGTLTDATSHTLTLSNPTAISVGNHLIMSLALNNGTTTISSLTDSRGNTWTIHRSAISGSTIAGYLASCKVTTPYQSGDAITFTTSSSVNKRAIVDEFSGLHGTVWAAGGNSTASSSASFQSGATAVAAAAGDLVYGSVACTSLVSVAAEVPTPTAWTVLTSSPGPNALFAHGAYRVVDGAESPNFNGTQQFNSNFRACIEVFRTAGAGGGGSAARSFAVIIG